MQPAKKREADFRGSLGFAAVGWGKKKGLASSPGYAKLVTKNMRGRKRGPPPGQTCLALGDLDDVAVQRRDGDHLGVGRGRAGQGGRGAGGEGGHNLEPNAVFASKWGVVLTLFFCALPVFIVCLLIVGPPSFFENQGWGQASEKNA